MWNLHSGKRLGLFEAPQAHVLLGFRAGGLPLAAIVNHRAMQVWDVLTGKELTPAGGHQAEVVRLTFTAGGKELVSLSADGCACRWDAATGKQISRVMPDGERGGHSVYAWGRPWLSPDGKYALAEEKSALRLYELAGGRTLFLLPNGGGVRLEAVFSPDGNLLALSGQDPEAAVGAAPTPTVRLIDVNTGQELQRWKVRKSWVDRLAFSPDGKVFASLAATQSMKAELYVWDVRKGKPLWHEIVPAAHLISFSPNGRLLATGGWKSTTLWHPTTGQCLCRLERGDIKGATFSPDSRLLLTGRCDGSRWHYSFGEIGSGTERSKLVVEVSQNGGVSTLALSPDGRRLATGMGDGTILLWDLAGRVGETAPKGKPGTQELEDLWKTLNERDGRAGLRAMQRFARCPGSCRGDVSQIPQTRPRRTVSADTLGKWIANLDSDNFDEREQASKELESLRKSVEEPIQKALMGNVAPEAKRRLTELLEKIHDLEPPAELVGPLRALEVLEEMATPEARKLLELLALGQAEAPLTMAAKEALGRLGQAGKP